MTAIAVERGPAKQLLEHGWALLAGIYAAIAALIAMIVALRGWSSAWRALGVPGGDQSFLDTRSLTSAWECSRRGVDVLAANPCDPLQRPFNYPRVWTAGSYLGLGTGATIAVAALFCLLAAVALVFVARDLSQREAALFAVVTASPPVLLGFERGNTDLAVFALVVFAALAARGAFLGAAVLKLYPIVAISSALRGGRRGRRVAYGACALFFVYVLATFHDLRLINAGTPRATAYSYGAMTGPRIAHAWGAGRAVELAVLLVSLVAIAAGAYAIVRRQRPVWSHRRESGRRFELFWAGSTIFLATFALGSNFEYRLIFLTLTVPQLLAWSARGRSEAAVARPLLATLLGYVWLKHIALAEPFEWILCAGFLALVWLKARPRAASDQERERLLAVHAGMEAPTGHSADLCSTSRAGRSAASQ